MQMTAVETATSNRTERRRSRLTAVVVAVVAASVLWAVIELAFGLDLRGPTFPGGTMDVALGHVAIGSLSISLAGWALLAALEHAVSRPRRVWTAIAVIVLLVSLGGPLSGTGVTTANRLSLVLLHLLVGATLIPLLWRTATATVGDEAPTRGPRVDRNGRLA